MRIAEAGAKCNRDQMPTHSSQINLPTGQYDRSCGPADRFCSRLGTRTRPEDKAHDTWPAQRQAVCPRTHWTDFDQVVISLQLRCQKGTCKGTRCADSRQPAMPAFAWNRGRRPWGVAARRRTVSGNGVLQPGLVRQLGHVNHLYPQKLLKPALWGPRKSCFLP